MESHKRSVVKALSWRIIAVCITALTVYVFTSEGDLALEVGLADSAIKIFIYYGHERLWNRVTHGKGREEEPDYTV
jgi:uncharacterized membrane protein